MINHSPNNDLTTKNSEILPWEFLSNLANFSDESEKLSEIYKNNKPFPHIVLDNFLNPFLIDLLANSFPCPNESFWTRTDIKNEIKSASTAEAYFPNVIRSCLYAMNSGPMIYFLEKLTGIKGLIPDPFFAGGGLHQTLPGGRLGVHVDFSQKPETKTYRRLNLLIYLNQDWKEDYGGELELWDPKGKKCEKKVAPQANRCVIFSTTDTSFHGHPRPLTCPTNRSRNSLALYYYTATPAEGKKTFIHGTVFLDTSSTSHYLVKKARRLISLFCPPIFLNAIKFCAAQMGYSR